MAKVTVKWRNGGERSFDTYDPATIARYQGYVDTDPGIKSVTVTGPGYDPEEPDDE